MIRIINGLKFKIRELEKSDFDIVQGVLIKKEYTQDNFKINKNDTVIDIGAHIGTFSIYAARAAKNVTVYSYEHFWKISNY